MPVRRIVLILLCDFIALSSACQQSQPPAATVTASPQAQSRPVTSPKPLPEASQVSPPGTAELREVLVRIYKNVVTVDESRRDAFVMGDFNGDNSQDIAIVVRPSKGMLAELNSEYANWILEDPISVGELLAARSAAHSSKPSKESAPIVVRPGDTLLAVVHGYQQAGWHNPKATQSYLLKNAVGDKMEMQPARVLISATSDKRNLPPLIGDVIRGTLAARAGFLYWNGAKYAWHRSEESP
jgi:hypothetical protein